MPEPMPPLRTAFLLFPGVTQLDLTGPAQFLSLVGRVSLVAKSLDSVMTESRFAIVPTATFETAEIPDILCIPGGMGITDAIEDDATMAWVRRMGASATWVTSVCTGSLILGAAGLLRGYRATTHWAWREHLAQFGAEPVNARTVIDRNRVTGGGVTAGTDFALTLIAHVSGEETAKRLQLAMEYDPAPPFDAGSPERAGPAMVARQREMMAARFPDRPERLRQAALRHPSA